MKNVYLTESELKELPEYSTSLPTGTTCGKQWKRHVYIMEANGKVYNAGYVPRSDMLVTDDYWLMGEYGEAYVEKISGRRNIDKVPIIWRKVVLKTKETEVPNHVNALGL